MLSIRSLVAVVSASLGLSEALSIRDLAPGSQACANLTSLLGSSKVSTPGALEYLGSRLDYWNAKLSDYTPTCAVYPLSAQDVSVALQAVRAAGSRFAIKTGGHNPNTFFASVDSGVLIDLGQMTERTYDNSTTLGTYQPGGVFRDIYAYFQQYGRTVLGARLGAVGTGLALGGGLSYLSGQYGMSCDNFRELEIVLPSGEIVTASPAQNEDLFFAARGGGGNAYGVVTKYTIQTRPSGTFYGGSLVYILNESQAVLDAVNNFMMYNTDPKAAIIGTFEKLGTPELGVLNLDEVIIIFLVYDGPDPGNAFANFTAIPHLINDMKQRPYSQITELPFSLVTYVTRGNNIFRVQVHRVDDGSYNQAYQAWKAWCEANKGSYVLASIEYQPVSKALTDASNSQNGGNAMQMPEGPWYWINYLIQTPLGMSDQDYDNVQASYRDMVNSVPNAEGLPLFINDANVDQDPLKTFSTYSRLQSIKAKYDPEGFFSNYTGGWSFD